MDRVLPKFIFGIFALLGLAFGQVTPAQSVVSSAPGTSATADPVASTEDTPDVTLDPASLLPDLPSLPHEKATLVGGSIEKIDRLQDQLTLRVFGGGRMRVVFDPRTRIYRDGQPASATDLQSGDRIYVDTILNGATVFARNIRLKTDGAVGESQGVVVSYHSDKGELLVRDQLSPGSLRGHISPSTKIVQDDHALPANQLVPGTLVALKFGTQSGKDPAREIREISVLAIPGSSFTFAGEVTTLNLKTGLLILTSSTDHKTYEIYLDPSVIAVNENLQQGADVSVLARFDGDHYTARTLTVNPR